MDYTGTTGVTAQPGRRRIISVNDESDSIPFMLDASEVNGFRNTYELGAQYPNSDLFIDTIDFNYVQADSTVGPVIATLNLKGKEDSPLSNGGATVVGRSLRALSAVISKSGVNYDVEYVAPVATVTWFSTTDPTGPDKESFTDLDDIEIKIAKVVKVGGESPEDPKDFFTKDTHYELRNLESGFQSNPIGPSRWQVKEVWTRVMDNIED